MNRPENAPMMTPLTCTGRSRPNVSARCGPKIVGIIEHPGYRRPDRGRDHQPEHAPVEPCPHHRPIDQRIQVDAGESASQCFCGLCHGAPLRGRRDPTGRAALSASVEPQSPSVAADRRTRAAPSSDRRNGSASSADKKSVFAGIQYRAGIRPSDIGFQVLHRIRIRDQSSPPGSASRCTS